MRMQLTVTGALLLLAAGAQAQNDAKELYLNKCAACHGPDGAGKTIMGKKLKVADVRTLVPKHSAEEMITVVQNGKGDSMKAYSKDFNKDQIKALVEYFRNLAKP